jgi:hypothetical protein
VFLSQTKLLTIEIYKWIKDAVKAQLTNIKPVQVEYILYFFSSSFHSFVQGAGRVEEGEGNG